ncbi:UvrD-helicase domain-containing protein [Campylobacter sp. RM9344]|uniref:DNA 3'-5' helicase n=1 Tax=Campylobacter californiensis TaxID=1032243 RepID=A0AAW3ZRE7_9BACT|nr:MULTISPECIES: UvrD-helicase domain-containing protein [unclassified Campylobacter]MBE2983949.1 UvrD-helicase domain-containing protein [Campylobacter sp. RM6883]MBE2994487.1 UvrD-helicase domain-containing protein [Campylobacter sp. RM6913]MBE3028795.1 UvrD-helicase domain-containing protein [Campylobacter sp. RM9344]MBE3607684.1 UvrD-helicase domain-containing protein [Campylobacter sp. RM9337]QCD51076.1 UvrD/REP family helicase [Campylobacter sp. RM6914]
MQNLLNQLNDSQQEAARHIDGAMLILAGAGSGKTKTITTRLAYLIGEVGIDPANTLTLTFTNKAANEMRSRALAMLSDVNTNFTPLLCTFHKFGLLFLKFYISKIGRKNNFIIIDTDDKKRIIKSFESQIATSILANEISNYKNSLLSVEDVYKNANFLNNENGKDGFYQKVAVIYERYEEYLKTNNLVDFDDLLMLTYKILDENEDLAREISNRYKYIMVDEYQDTNDLQYKLLRKLCATHENICVVGDDDQSIYGWRGAKVENILNFKDQFKDVKIIRLEQNYRSTTPILKAANELIDHNRNRLGKNLISVSGDGEEIKLMESFDENIESNKIAKQIKELLLSGVAAKDIAILYRINALSRSLEDGLNKEKIPYKMVGGIKFYERAEIKDIISYLRLVINQNDDFSIKRIINRPKRGLGKISLEKLEKIAFDNKISLFEAILAIDEKDEVFSKKIKSALIEFTQNLKELQGFESLYELIDKIETKFGIKKYYESLPDGSERAANIDEFYAMLKDQIKQNPSFDLDEFLNELTITSEQDNISSEAISIMSVHASKGLEFEHLFVIGFEEGFFPLIGDGSDIEEERRLAYVAITRAKRNLTLTFANSRFYKGQRTRLNKSRFLSESGLVQGSLVIEQSNEYKKGDLVKHKIFGIGRVTEVSKVKKELKLTINFAGNVKEIMSSFVEHAV